MKPNALDALKAALVEHERLLNEMWPNSAIRIAPQNIKTTYTPNNWQNTLWRGAKGRYWKRYTLGE